MIRRVEWGLAVGLTLLAAAIHFSFMRHAGALWRDEAGVVSLAGMAKWREVWANLCFDSFPIFWIAVLRFWIWIGLGGDGPFRLLGFLVGLSILGALWFNARQFKISF